MQWGILIRLQYARRLCNLFWGIKQRVHRMRTTNCLMFSFHTFAFGSCDFIQINNYSIRFPLFAGYAVWVRFPRLQIKRASTNRNRNDQVHFPAPHLLEWNEIRVARPNGQLKLHGEDCKIVRNKKSRTRFKHLEQMANGQLHILQRITM